MVSSDKIAKLLRTDSRVISDLGEKLGAISGKMHVLDAIVEEIEEKTASRLTALGLDMAADADEIHRAYIAKIQKEDQIMFELFKRPNFSTTEGCQIVIESAKTLSGNLQGFFLKKERAREFLETHPPQNILKMARSRNVEELLKNEDLLEVFSALRFGEDPKWLNETFFSQYHGITPDDFEMRPIEVRVLGGAWKERAQKYATHKLHHISHLKELGIIFIIPLGENYPGSTLEVFTLLLHYFHEVDFYARLFRTYSSLPNFTERMISALRGDVLETPVPRGEGLGVRIVQRYLAKDDPNDPRLFEPHVNPEVIHWAKGEGDIVREGERFISSDLEFFRELDFVGEYFNSRKHGKEVLMSFDLVDGVVSLAKKSNVETRYYYHQHEALWNKIFNEYFGFDAIESFILENLDRGHIIFNSSAL